MPDKTIPLTELPGVGPARAKKLDRLGLRRTCTCSLLLLALSSFLFGAVRQFPLYCAASALVGLAYSWGGMISASLLVDRWFQDRQALALAAQNSSYILTSGGDIHWAEDERIGAAGILLPCRVRDEKEFAEALKRREHGYMVKNSLLSRIQMDDLP